MIKHNISSNFSVFVLAAAGLLGQASAQTTATWTGAADNTYGNAANWDTLATPGTGVDVVISSGTAANSSGNFSRQGAGATTLNGTATLNVTGGSGVGRLFNNGLFTVADGATLNHSGDYFISGANGIGDFQQTGGTVNSTPARGFFLSDGANSKGTTYHLSGGSLVVNSSASGVSGEPGSGFGGDRELRSVFLGKGTGSSATGDMLRISGGTASFTKSLSTPPNRYTSDVLIGRDSTISIEGGVVSFANYNEFRVGYGNTGLDNNVFSVSGGTVSLLNIPQTVLGYNDNGELRLSGGELSIQGALSIGRAGGAEGLVSMSDGILELGALTHVNGLFQYEGGEIFIDGDQRSVIDQAWFQAGGLALASYDGQTTHITLIPEPGTASLFALGGAAALLRRRRA